MPYIVVRTSQKTEDKKEALFTGFGELISIFPQKTEKWLMVNLEGEQEICFAGREGDAALVQVVLYAKAENQPEVYNEFTQKATELVCRLLDLPRDRVYVIYTATPHWGWNGKNL